MYGYALSLRMLEEALGFNRGGNHRYKNSR